MITDKEFKNHIYNNYLTLEICKEWVGGGGGDINIQTENGHTALILVSYYGHIEIG
jgi:ankyrin repeat protein